MWHDAFDRWNALDQRDDLTVDQRIELAKVQALLSVAQEINHVRHNGINPEFDAN